jgi:hypothetical protein
MQCASPLWGKRLELRFAHQLMAKRYGIACLAQQTLFERGFDGALFNAARTCGYQFSGIATERRQGGHT